MAAKRLREREDEGDSDTPSDQDKRTRTAPSLSTVFREALAIRSLQSFAASLEPLLRRVVNEEVERGLVQGSGCLQGPSMRQIQAAETTTLQLTFSKSLSLPIFTGSKIEDAENHPLRVLLVDTRSGGRPQPVSPPAAIRVEIVVLDGDFPGKRESWTSAEFERSIVKERTGKRPLVTGDIHLTLRDGGGAAVEDLTFTDNSSWIRSRHFRLGARVAAAGSCVLPAGLAIKEAMTEPFTVKDHRGELYKKHYPPSLHDEVWRLEKIGKEGVFHQKLRAEGINTVQEFLKLWAVDPARLRAVLGNGMSDKMWEGTVSHARTCELGGKLYLHRSARCLLLLSPICQVQAFELDGQSLPPQRLNVTQRAFLQQQVVEAYEHWNQLEVVDEASSSRAARQQQGKVAAQITAQPFASPPSTASSVYATRNQGVPAPNYPQGGGFEPAAALRGDAGMDLGGWIHNPEAAVHKNNGRYNDDMREFSSEEDEDPSSMPGIFPGGF